MASLKFFHSLLLSETISRAMAAQIMEGRPSPVVAPAYGAKHWNNVSLCDTIHILLWSACLDSENGLPPRVPELGARIWRCARQLLDNFDSHHITLFPQETHPPKKAACRLQVHALSAPCARPPLPAPRPPRPLWCRRVAKVFSSSHIFFGRESRRGTL